MYRSLSTKTSRRVDSRPRLRVIAFSPTADSPSNPLLTDLQIAVLHSAPPLHRRRRCRGRRPLRPLPELPLRGVGEQGCHSQFREKQAAGLCSRQDLSFPSSLRPGSACSSLPTDRPAMAILAPFCSPRRPLQHQIEPAAQSRHYSADSTCTPDAICFICCNCKRQSEAAEGRVRWCTS